MRGGRRSESHVPTYPSTMSSSPGISSQACGPVPATARPHPLSQVRHEFIWEGKYDEQGHRRTPDVPALSLRIVEEWEGQTVNGGAPRGSRHTANGGGAAWQSGQAAAPRRGNGGHETNLFEEKKSSSFYSKDGIRKDVLDIKEYKNFNGTMNLEIEKGLYPEKEDISKFEIKGSFKIIQKRKKCFIECVSNVAAKNGIFGKFDLEKDKFYSFNLVTLGRDPKLKRNNLFISKKRIYQLVEEGQIRKPEIIVEEITKNI